LICARLRALQLEPKGGESQWWAQVCTYVCTASVFTLMLITILKGNDDPRKQRESEERSSRLVELERARSELAELSKGFNAGGPVDRSRLQAAEQRVRDVEQRVQALDNETDKGSLGPKGRMADRLRWAVMVCLYIGAILIIVSIVLHERPRGSTPALPTSMKCTIILTTQYFAVYLGIGIMDKLGGEKGSSRLWKFLTSFGKNSVDFNPALSLLFLGTFLRALQITGGQGAPPWWVQEFMWLATWSVLIQFLTRADELFEVSPRIRKLSSIIFYVVVGFMYLAVAGVIVGLFTMTPETAHGTGSLKGGEDMASSSYMPQKMPEMPWE